MLQNGGVLAEGGQGERALVGDQGVELAHDVQRWQVDFLLVVVLHGGVVELEARVDDGELECVQGFFVADHVGEGVKDGAGDTGALREAHDADEGPMLLIRLLDDVQGWLDVEFLLLRVDPALEVDLLGFVVGAQLCCRKGEVCRRELDRCIHKNGVITGLLQRFSDTGGLGREDHAVLGKPVQTQDGAFNDFLRHFGACIWMAKGIEQNNTSRRRAE